jgi:hypothetical protein
MIPHRTKLRELIIKAWQRYFQALKKDLEVFYLLIHSTYCSLTRNIQHAVGRVSFTTDIWSDKNRRPYLAITAHWIAKLEGTTSLQLKASLIAFHRLRGNHDGVSLAKTVLHLLDRAGVTVKVTFYNVCRRQIY